MGAAPVPRLEPGLGPVPGINPRNKQSGSQLTGVDMPGAGRCEVISVFVESMSEWDFLTGGSFSLRPDSS